MGPYENLGDCYLVKNFTFAGAFVSFISGFGRVRVLFEELVSDCDKDVVLVVLA